MKDDVAQQTVCEQFFLTQTVASHPVIFATFLIAPERKQFSVSKEMTLTCVQTDWLTTLAHLASI